MTTQSELDTLIRIFLQARNRLLALITGFAGVGTKTYANTILKQVQRELERLQAASTDFINVAIPAEYHKNLDEMYEYFSKTNLLMSKSFMFAQVHTDAVYVISREMQYQISEGIAKVGRQVMRYVDDARDEMLRQIGLQSAGEKLASTGSIGEMKRNMVNLLQKNGFMTIQYGNAPGRQVPIDAYARMVARSTAREAANTARLNTMDQLGYDLVRVTEHYPTCAVCAAHQGRVYSVSGNDPRFPALYSLPGFKDGYRNFHPNCRHVITPTVESLWTKEQRAKYLSAANSPAAGDPRTAEMVDLYNKQQGQNRAYRNDMYQFERYQARLGADAPKSLRAFRQIKLAGGDDWSALQYYYRNTGNRPVYCAKIDFELSKLGIDKGKVYPAQPIEIKDWNQHAIERLAEVGITKETAESWMNQSKIMMKRYSEPNTLFNYYHENGIIGIRQVSGDVRTIIDKERFGNETIAIQELIKKHVTNN